MEDMSNDNESLKKERIAREPKTNVENTSTNKIGQGEYMHRLKIRPKEISLKIPMKSLELHRKPSLLLSIF